MCHNIVYYYVKLDLNIDESLHVYRAHLSNEYPSSIREYPLSIRQV